MFNCLVSQCYWCFICTLQLSCLSRYSRLSAVCQELLMVASPGLVLRKTIPYSTSALVSRYGSIPWRPRTMTMTATATKMWKTNSILSRNCQIHGEFTVIPSSENKISASYVFGRHGLWPSWLWPSWSLFVAIMVCGCHGHCLWPSWFVAVIYKPSQYPIHQQNSLAIPLCSG